MGQTPFKRYYKGSPQTEHYYSTLPSEESMLTGAGYYLEAQEGYVFKQYKPGSTALLRYSRSYPATSDLEHYYTITVNDPNAAGWTYDGAVAYVCPQ